jgi:ABC-2 type transport system ATP-binding protein
MDNVSLIQQQILMLKIDGLVKKYEGQLAVDNVSLYVERGKIFGLLGPNGAGKSSLLRMITGITLPDEGQVLFDGEPFDLNKHMSQIGYMPEERGLYKKMKVKEQLSYLAQLKGLSGREANNQISYWFEKLEMNTWAQKKVEDLSKGMSQKLQFVTTVLHKPKLLILDEPFSGLDPVNAQIIKDEIFDLAQKGTTIIFSTHRMEQVEEICEDIVLMDKGRVILDGTVEEAKQTYKQNKFRLVLEKPISYLPFDNHYDEKGGYDIRLKPTDNSNDILAYCLEKKAVVKEFSEVLPTLNEIFISLVNQSANRQFQTQ